VTQVLVRTLLVAACFVAVVSSLTFHRSSGLLRPTPADTDPAVRSAQDAGLDNDWFLAQRSYPFNDIPAGAHETMRRVMRSRFSGKDRPRESNAVTNWSLVGPSNIGGRVMAVLVHPTNPDIIYAGSASGGVWKSTDFGGTWANIFNESYSVGALAFEPGDPNTVYVGTGENSPAGVATYPGNGIWRSTDAGATWTNIGLADIGYTGKIAINPSNPKTIYVAAIGLYRAKTTQRGIFRSTDRGATWTKVLYLNDTTCAIDVVINPLDTAQVYAAMWTRYRTPHVSVISGPSSGLYRSDDAGAHWSLVTDGFPNNDPNLGRISLTYSPSVPYIMYALTQSGVGWGGMYRSSDGGLSWALTYDGTANGEGQVWYNNVVTVDPGNPDALWAGMTTLYKSTNGGSTFSGAPIVGAYHPDHHAMVYAPSDPSRVVLGNDGGIFTSTDGGASWWKSYNLPITQFYAGAVSAQNPNRIMGGAQDNNSMQTHDAVVGTWSPMYCCDGFYCLIDPTDSNYVYAEYQNGGLGYSTNGGGSFSYGGNGTIGGDRWNWETPIAMDLQHPKTLYTGSQRVYRTKNNMQLWTPISGDLTYGNGGRVGMISTIDVSRTDSNVVYVGTDDGRVWVTTNGGTTWTDIALTLPLRWVTRVTVDPDSAQIAYVTLSGFIENDMAGHVYRTTNFGNTWSNIGTSLPDIPVNDIVVDPGNRSTLYIATDLNVMVSYNLGASWSLFGDGLPEVPVHDLALHAGSRTLVAFTHGRSAFRCELPSAGTMAVDVALNRFWNLVSNPVSGTDGALATLYPSALSAAYGYTPGGYATSPTLENGRGYWVKFPSSTGQHAVISGSAIAAETVAVSAGWNLVGSISGGIPVASVGSDPPGLVTSQFFGYEGSYASADSVLPGRAYWVKLDAPGALLLASGVEIPSAQRIVLRPTAELPPPPPSVPDLASHPAQYALAESYPNPFNPSTTIRYTLGEPGEVSLRIYDLTGREVATLTSAVESAGEHQVSWNAAGMASGVYLCRMEASGSAQGRSRFTAMTKLVLLR
jgi:photosystem II stability/assembly factor-like uncharacterized protein